MLVAQEHWNLACSDTVSSPCDFTGSVKEWVNDWYGGYKDTTYENYAGISGGGPLNTRIVKGGSFKDDASGVHVYDRTDVYPVTADLKMDYIGFRIAYGAVPHPILTDYRGFVVQNDAEVTITSEEFRAKFGTTNGKLVFRNEASGNLMYVNFAGGDPVVQEIIDSLESITLQFLPMAGMWLTAPCPKGCRDCRGLSFAGSRPQAGCKRSTWQFRERFPVGAC